MFLEGRVEINKNWGPAERQASAQSHVWISSFANET